MVTKKQKESAPEIQIPLLQVDESWKEHYKGMPPYEQKNLTPYKSIIVHFLERSDMIAFQKVAKQKITESTKYIWFPESEVQVNHSMKWISTNEEEILDENES